MCFSATLWANNIDIQLVQQSTLSSEPGKVHNFSIVVINNGTNSTQLQPKLDVPEGWKVITDKSTIRLKAGEKRIKLFSFIIPARALAGDYKISYRLTNIQQPEKEYSNHFSFKVSATNKISVVALSAPTTVMAGAKLRGEFSVKNSSNQAQKIQLSSDNGKVIGESTITLAPFANQKVIVETTTFAETRKESHFNIDLNAAIKGVAFNRTGYLHSKILPSIDYEQDDTRKLPGYASLNLLHRQFSDGRRGQGWQGELYLNGTIDEKKEQEVTLSLRGPNQQESTELTLYDEYYAAYRNKDFAVTLGDNNFVLSPLTEFSRNGRGIKGEGYFGTATAGAFYVNPRIFSDLNGEFGAFVQNRFNAKSTIQFNFLHKISSELGTNSSILSLFGQFKPFKNTLVEAEFASNNSGEGAYVKIQSRFFDRLRLNGNLTYASPNFTGYFQNTLNYFTHLNYRLTNNIDLVAGVFQDDRNAALDTIFQAAPLIDRRHVGLRIKMGRQTQFQINLRQNEIEDRLPKKQFFRKENLITAGVNHNSRRFIFGLIGEFGKSQNFLQTTETDAQDISRLFVDLGFKTSKFSFKLFGQYYSENNLQIADQKQLLWGGSLAGNIRNKTRLQLRYQNDFTVDEYYRNRNALDFFLTQTIKKKHQFILNARQTIRRNTLDQKDFTVSAKYVYNFGIRLEEKPPTGDVYGQIQRKNGHATKNILVFLNGKTAITDAEGNFQFKNMKPGKYPIMLDPSTLDLHEILADSSLPIVEILPETNQKVQLELIQSGEIIGGIEFKKSKKSSAQLMSLKSVGNLMLEITNGDETRRTFTDDNGQFKFGDLRPGTWQIEVLKPSIDKNLSLTQTHFTIKIAEGQQVDLPIIIQQKKRNIQFKKLIQLSDDDG